jgi:hypothetical protein
MSNSTGLLGQRVKILLRRTHPQTPREIVRGIITEVDESGIRVSGRRFHEVPDLETSLPEECPVEAEAKVYWIPFTSVRYSEILLPGSPSEKLDNEIQLRRVLSPQETHRPTVP